LRAERRQQKLLAGAFAARACAADDGGETWFTVAGHRLPASQLQPWLHAAVAKLSSLDQQLLLALQEGFCCEELAERFCQTASCVKTRIHRARLRVRNDVEDSVCKALALAP
jgi:DNA-directed RNA polymerase specialized sigma24 family protein